MGFVRRLYCVREDQDNFLLDKSLRDYNKKGNKKSTILRRIIDEAMITEAENLKAGKTDESAPAN